MAGQWPLVGRDDELDLIEERLAEASNPGVVIAGPAGVGKTRLVNELLARRRTRGDDSVRLVGSRSAAHIPFGAFAPVLPDGERSADSPATFLRRAAEHIAANELTVVVDDAHDLDDASAALVHQLAEAAAGPLILTVRTGETVPDAVEKLWKEGLATRIDLAALSRAEVEQLLGEVLGGSVDGSLVQYVWTASQGNPLYLRELVVGAQEAGALSSAAGMWRMLGRPATPPRLRELVERRLALLDEAQRGALELLAVADTIGMRLFEDLVGSSVLEQLERRDLVTVAADGRRRNVRLVHPLHGEVLREAMPVSRNASLQRTLARSIEGSGRRRRGDATRAAALLLAADGRADLDALERAVTESLLVHDPGLLEHVARAGLDAGGGLRFTRLLAETMRWQGKPEEAERLLAEVDLAAIDDEEEVALMAMVRADCLFRALGRREQAIALLEMTAEHVTEPAWLAEMDALRGVFDATTGLIPQAIERLMPHAASPVPRVVLTALPGLVPALAMAGRYDEAIDFADRGFALATSVGPQPMLSDPGLHLITRCIALCDAGRLAEADATGQLGYDWSLETGSVAGQAWFALVLGFTASSQGRLSEALHNLREAANGFADLAEPGLRRLALGSAAEAAGARGDAAVGTDLLAQMDAIGHVSVAIGDIQVTRGRAWVDVARGRIHEAREQLRRASDEGIDAGISGLASFALHDLVRLRDAEYATVRMERLRGVVQGLLHPIRADHAAAMVGEDGAALDDVSQRFEDLGAVLWAAEAAADAAAAHRKNRANRLATASSVRSAALARQCEGASTPALPTAAERDGPGTLTRREEQIARLAAAGATSKQIASELFLSVRTVDNHLQRVYTKLGVSGRSELATRFEAMP